MARTFVNLGDTIFFARAPTGNATVYTYACWFKANTATVAYNFMEQDDNGVGTNFVLLRTDAAGHVRWTTPATNALTTTTFSASTWNHACGVSVSATDRRVFLNGGGKGTNTGSYTPASLARTGIGSSFVGAASPMKGAIAEVAIWSIALSDAEVALLAGTNTSATTPPISPLLMHPESLVFYCPLVAGYSPEVDLMNSTTGTIAGPPAISAHPRIFGASMHRKFRFGQAAAAAAPAYLNYAMYPSIERRNVYLGY